MNNQLTLLKDLGMRYTSNTKKYKRRYGLYKCYCGNKFETKIDSVKRGNTKSCGCLKIKILDERNNKHGLTNHKLFSTWANMMQRCYNENNSIFKNYGGRGIKVCNEWHNPENFINDMYPTYKIGLSIDRINVNDNYYKDNCRWENKNIQSRNTRKLRKNNTSGYRGVYWNKNDKRWIAQITVNNKTLYIGSFVNKIDGARAYDKYIIENNLEHTRNFTD